MANHHHHYPSTRILVYVAFGKQLNTVFLSKSEIIITFDERISPIEQKYRNANRVEFYIIIVYVRRVNVVVKQFARDSIEKRLISFDAYITEYIGSSKIKPAFVI